MKKIYTLIFTFFILLNFSSIAQTGTCNAEFSFTIQNNNHVVFTPVQQGDSANTIHTWSFGDGTTGNIGSPTHNYSNSGTYTVLHTITRYSANNILCTATFSRSIIINNSCNLSVNFSFKTDSLHTGNFLQVYFINYSAPVGSTDSLRWNFGDGTFSNQLNPIHNYATAGTYNVCLRIIKRNAHGELTNCASDICHTIVVAGTCSLHAAFTKSADATNPRKLHFNNITATVTSNPSAIWSFGDGTSSPAWSPVHEYAHAGRYYVCLKVEDGPNCRNTICDSISVNTILTCNEISASYTSVRDSLIPNKYHFSVNSNSPTVHQTWTILKAPFTGIPITIQQNNPLYTFQDTGRYRICVRAEFAGNCIKEFCNYINVEHRNIPAGCTFYPYPNPAHNEVNANVQINQPQLIHAFIYNASDVLVRQKTINAVSGNNLVTVNLGDLGSGIYTMKIIHGNDVCSAHFVKL